MQQPSLPYVPWLVAASILEFQYYWHLCLASSLALNSRELRCQDGSLTTKSGDVDFKLIVSRSDGVFHLTLVATADPRIHDFQRHLSKFLLSQAKEEIDRSVGLHFMQVASNR